MKNIIKKASMLVLIMAFLLSGCALSNDGNKTVRNDDWLTWAKLDADETPDELYDAALNEETLVVYTHSTRLYDTKEAFEASYPGLTVDVQFLRAVDIAEQLKKGYENDEFVCDVVISSDASTIFTTDFIPNGVLHKYVPPDIAKKIRPEFNDDLLYFMVEGLQLFYNTDFYDEAPISNWWELTEPEYKGKISMVDPIRSVSQFVLLCTIIQNEDEMADAYEDLYRTPLEIPEGSSAGQIFWERLVGNGVQLAATTDEVVDMVGLPSEHQTPIGIVISSKARKTDIGYPISPIYNVKPFSGVFSPASVSVSGQAKSINSAKLFVRFLLGEADGQGEGYKPYLQNGAWSVRSDIDSDTKITLEDTGFLFQDKEYYAENNKWISDWWLALRDGNSEE